MAITSLKTNAFRRSLSSYCQNFTVSFPVGTLKWRNSLLALAQALTRGPPLQNTFVPEIGAPNWGKSDPDRLLEGGSHQECHYARIHELDKRSRVDWTLVALVWDNVHAEWQLQLRMECRHIKAQIYLGVKRNLKYICSGVLFTNISMLHTLQGVAFKWICKYVLHAFPSIRKKKCNKNNSREKTAVK